MMRALAKLAFLILEPIYPVRFIRIFSSRIGHCAADMDLFQRRLRLKPTKAKLIYFALHDEPVANKALLGIWQAMLPVIHRDTIGRIWQWLFLKIRGSRFLIELCPSGQEYRAWHVPHIAKKPARLIESPYAIFHSRDKEYLSVSQPGRDYTHNDYRNCSIDACLPAADYITERGLVAVRVGRHVEKLLDSDNPKICDYPPYHDEATDLKLAAHCEFYIGPNNGTAQLPLLFDRPIAYTNSVPLWMLNWGKNCLFIPKLFRAEGSSDLLPFRELERLGAFDHVKRQGIHTKWYADRGIELVENTPEDILDLCKDMFDLIDGAKPIDLQAEYKERYFSGQAERQWAPNIGPRFIEKYEILMVG
jgi:putative glycosyltransferase (TIGR04372 family)